MLTQAWNTLLLELVKSVNAIVTTPELSELAERIESLKYGDPSLMAQFREDALLVSKELSENDVGCLSALRIFAGCRIAEVFAIMSESERSNAFTSLKDLYNRATLEKTCRSGIEDVQALCAETIQNAEMLGVDLKDPVQAMPALLRSMCSAQSMQKVSHIVKQITRTADPQDVFNLLNFNGAGAIGETLAAEMRRAQPRAQAGGGGGGEVSEAGAVDAGGEADTDSNDPLTPESIAQLMATAMGSQRPGAPVSLKDLFAQMSTLFPAPPQGSRAEEVD
jgi:hypothetical protein